MTSAPDKQERHRDAVDRVAAWLDSLDIPLTTPAPVARSVVLEAVEAVRLSLWTEAVRARRKRERRAVAPSTPRDTPAVPEPNTDYVLMMRPFTAEPYPFEVGGSRERAWAVHDRLPPGRSEVMIRRTEMEPDLPIDGRSEPEDNGA
jgi:hypothetical protein